MNEEANDYPRCPKCGLSVEEIPDGCVPSVAMCECEEGCPACGIVGCDLNCPQGGD